MKLNYELEEDSRFLRAGLHLALMGTERIFDPSYHIPECREHLHNLMAIRRKLHEFLGEPDPNHQAIQEIIKLLA